VAASGRTIFVTGATGLLGSQLCASLIARGDRVLAHRRGPIPESPSPALTWLGGDLCAAGDWQAALAEADAVVHLAGAPIAKGRWTRARKQELRESRIASTREIATALARMPRPPATFVCASASGYYGPRGGEWLDESSGPGDDFLARLCVDWEAAALTARGSDVRVAVLRFGAILSRRGGLLARVLRPFRLGVGGALGPSDRYLPWIHEADAVGLIEWALAAGPGRDGALNAVAPDAITMGQWTATLARVLGRPALLPLPTFALRLALGEMGGALVPGQRMAPRAALAGGYTFLHPALEEALRALLD